MATKEEYTQLSLYVYDINDSAHRGNRPLLPTGWEELEYQPDNGVGFSCGVFRRRGATDVVVAYTGTNDLVLDWTANVRNGIGLSSSQTTAAALVYLIAKQRYGSNISLTGHSLGGGLASIMAVWFDRPAVVFDEAPFEATARNPWVLLNNKMTLAALGYSDAAFTSYTGLLDFYTREAQVTNHYLEGEALAALRLAFPTVLGPGQDNPVRANVADMAIAGSIELHSQALLTAMLMSDALRQSTYASTRVIPLLMDEKFYAYTAATSNQQNLLINLIRSEQAAAGNGKLTHLASDLQKLGANIAGLNTAAQNALIAQAIEWTYWKNDGYIGQEFFTRTGELLQYTTALGDNLLGAGNKAAPYVQKWLAPIVNAHGEFYSESIANYQQWNIAAGGSGISATARDGGKSQIFIGGSGADSFTGGQLADLMFAGDGADTLDGGAGNDQLFGGLGNDLMQGGVGFDTYVIEGMDTIEDSDRQGSIKDKNGQRITGAIEKRADGSHVFLGDPTISVTGGSDLTLTLADGTGVTIKNYQTGDVGIGLSDNSAAAPPVNRTLVGDLSPIDFDPDAAGVQTRTDDLGNVIVAADQPEPGRADTLQDSAGNDDIRGLGGDDFLWAWRGGHDKIDGGDGNDVRLHYTKTRRWRYGEAVRPEVARRGYGEAVRPEVARRGYGEAVRPEVARRGCADLPTTAINSHAWRIVA